MNIDWTHFTPWSSLSGGIILGVASALFILINGRVLGDQRHPRGSITPKSRGHHLAPRISGWYVRSPLDIYHPCAPGVRDGPPD